MKVEITAQLTIAKLFELAPDSPIILENSGLKCTGCKSRTDRTLKELFQEHSLTAEQESRTLTHLNKLEQAKPLLKPEPEDSQIKEITQNNQKYYQIAGLLLTESAFQNLHNLANAKGLQIKLSAGGCSGFKYEYNFFDQPGPEEKIYPLSKDLAIYMDDFTFGRSKGATIEFKLGLHNSGLQIINPNQKRSCSCGTSIAF